MSRCECCYEHKSGFPCTCHINEARFREETVKKLQDYPEELIPKQIAIKIVRATDKTRHSSACKREARPSRPGGYYEAYWTCSEDCETNANT